MKIYYHKGTKWTWTPTRLPDENNLLALSYNNWDDYGVSTTLNAVLYIDKKPALEFTLKLLIKDDVYSAIKLNEFRENGWDGFFPIPKVNYASVPSDIKFYDALISSLGLNEAKSVLVSLRDAGYLHNVLKDPSIKPLVNDTNFVTSPLREAGARKSFADGWKLFVGETSSIKDFTLFTRGKGGGGIDPINFKFNSKTLPYDINVLIGPNGIGKSYTLKVLVEYLLGINEGSQTSLKKLKHQPFDAPPNAAKIILISYSPFEDFALDLSQSNLKDKDAYKYFGFRRQTVSPTTQKRRIGISRNLPSIDSVESIIKAFRDDESFEYMETWTSKVDAIWSVLQPALEFDTVALEISSSAEVPKNLQHALITLPNSDKKYIDLNKKNFTKIKKTLDSSPGFIKMESGVVFLRDKSQLELSSGQRLFCYIVVNIVGQIKSDSLVLVDEPELFLHPTLEIEFIGLLKKVLKAFNSKAILATHSLAIAREVPANCMHVYKKWESGLDIDHPPFETFGGDMQRISSYVFGDNKVSKPFSEWVDERVKEVGDPQRLIESLKGELNEELLIRIRNSGVGNGR